MAAEVVTIASEVLAGHTREGNFPMIVSVLAREGLAVTRHTTVPDERGAIVEALRSALSRSAVVLTTGGLGGTPDDLTRGVIASLLGRKLSLREPLRAALREKYRARGFEMPAAAEVMALLPAGARPLENRLGLAPGIHLEVDDRHLFALPGVSEEMEVMLREEVVPRLRTAKVGTSVAERTMRTVGVAETLLAEWVEPLLVEGVRAAYLPHGGRVDVRLHAAGPGIGEEAIETTEHRLRARLGPALYGVGERPLEA
ncbi:MAG: molybdopterin-binding protein, partial [Candidatus Eisenbacteria bacterium]